MCGIAGYLYFDKNSKAELSLLKKMTDVIAHRGPDGEGFHIDGHVALGHRRLSIIDLETGNQPMYSDDGKKNIVFNGEIYNYIELREELKLLGHQFKTNSDTEVILKSYEQWGYDCQSKFNGMWAFALWDESKDELFVSRDRFGEKPLHYSLQNNSFVFGSEIKSLNAYGLELVPRLELLQLYLTFTYIPAPNTFYKDIFKLLPGHFIIVKNNNLKIEKYWELPQIDEKSMLTNKQEVYSRFDYLLKDAIKLRMRSDVPFGAFLSGGLDSSAIVSQMAMFSIHPVNTFTIGFNDKNFDESEIANDVAKKFKTEHFVGTVSPNDFEKTLNYISYYFDEPFGDSSSIPTYQVSNFAHKKVKMVLTGDGGDEALSGYISYTGIKLSSILKKIPKSIRLIIIFVVLLTGRLFKGKLRYKLNKIKRIFETAELSFTDRMIIKGSSADINLIKELTKNIPNVIKVEDYLNELNSECSFNDDFYKLMFFNYKLSLPNDYLVKVDRASMANSLETRLPFLDYRLVEFMAKVHKDVKMQGWERKSVLRKTIGNKLPDSILKAKKRGFGIPIREWFKENDFNNYLKYNLASLSSILDLKTINKIISDNASGKMDNGNFIWTLLILNKKLQS